MIMMAIGLIMTMAIAASMVRIATMATIAANASLLVILLFLLDGP